MIALQTDNRGSSCNPEKTPLLQTVERPSTLEKIKAVAYAALLGFAIGFIEGLAWGVAAALFLSVKVTVILIIGMTVMLCLGSAIAIPPSTAAICLIAYATIIATPTLFCSLWGMASFILPIL